MTQQRFAHRVPLVGVEGALEFPSWVSSCVLGCVLAASFTATWTGLYLAGFQPADMFLFMALIVVAALVVFGALRFAIPWWIWPPVVALMSGAAVRAFSPVPAVFFAPRLQVPDSVPGGILKSVFWIVALVGVPVAVAGCSAIEARTVRWMGASFLGGVSASSLVSLTDLLGFTHIAVFFGSRDYGARQTGLAGHPNTLGVACVIATPLAIYFASETRTRLPALLSLGLLCGGVVASGSRGAQVVLPIAALATVFLSPCRRGEMLGRLALGAFVATAIGVAASTTMSPSDIAGLLRFGSSSGTSGSNSDRLTLADQALNDVSQYPFFGIGVNHISEAHDIYLQLLSAGGLVLVLGMFSFWGGLMSSGISGMRANVLMAPALTVSIMAWLMLGVIENQLTDRFLYYSVGGIAAIASARARRNRWPARPVPNAGRRRH